MKVIYETHTYGFLLIENEVKTGMHEVGIQTAEDGRIWICVDGVAFIRFKPFSKEAINGSTSTKSHALQTNEESSS
jgi:streptogramin lyase